MADARRSGETKPKKRRTSSRNCCVPGCTNNDKYGIDRDNRISFHRFPKDEKLRREWIWKVRRDEGIKVNTGHNFFPQSSPSCSSSIRSRHNYRFDYNASILCVVCLIPRHQSLGFPLNRKVDNGIFNVRNDLNACCAHEVKTDTDESAHHNLQLRLPPPPHPPAPGAL